MRTTSHFQTFASYVWCTILSFAKEEYGNSPKEKRNRKILVPYINIDYLLYPILASRTSHLVSSSGRRIGFAHNHKGIILVACGTIHSSSSSNLVGAFIFSSTNNALHEFYLNRSRRSHLYCADRHWSRPFHVVAGTTSRMRTDDTKYNTGTRLFVSSKYRRFHSSTLELFCFLGSVRKFESRGTLFQLHDGSKGMHTVSCIFQSIRPYFYGNTGSRRISAPIH